MPGRSRENSEVRAFILAQVQEHPETIAAITAETFGLSRTAVGRYLKRLSDEGVLIASGKTKDRRYRLARLSFRIEVGAWLDEDVVWRFRVLPHLADVKQNALDLCQYGFTEILNNVIDHSGSPDAYIQIANDGAGPIKMIVHDNGVGIFERIQRDFHLPDARSALLELSKGRITSDPARHAGEGIFFTSRMFDRFSIQSSTLFYHRQRQADDEWLIEVEEDDFMPGTTVVMEVSRDAAWTTRDVFDTYRQDSMRFRRTHVPLKLGRYPNEQLVSRSQAKRVLARFEQFAEVLLDFEGVDQIGQPFADEVFRVFANTHPAIRVSCVNAGPDILRMIAYVRGEEDGDSTQLQLF
ncbi:MAG: DUF4325 domain-containing protein [Magnetospirillum sp.]|nr:DUF4325 domain-containing protein [Magnetospirillum sp.]